MAQASWRLRGELSVPALQAAFSEVLDRHEILRTVFHRPRGMRVPLQVLRSDTQAAWHPIDTAADATTATVERLVDSLFDDPAAQGFVFPDDADLPSLHVWLARVPGHDPLHPLQPVHLLHVAAPAMCCDATSLRLLAELVAAAYATPGRLAALDEPVQYSQFSQWQGSLAEAEDEDEGVQDGSAAAHDFWQQSAASRPAAARLPFETPVKTGPDDASGNAPAFITRQTSRGLSIAQVHDLDGFCRYLGVAPREALLSVWAALLARLTGQRDLCLATAFDGRHDAELAQATGPLTRMAPLTLQLHSHYQFSEIVQRTHDAARQATAALDWLGLDGDIAAGPAAAPVVDFAFEFIDAQPAYVEGAPRFELLRQQVDGERFMLKLVCVRSDAGLRIEMHRDTARLPADAAACIEEQFHALLDDALGQREAELGQLSILSTVERQRLLTQFNATAQSFAGDGHGDAQALCAHHLFETQTALTPSARALAWDAGELTYAELDARAQRLAGHLRRLGVGREDRVGLCATRSPELVVGLLAVLKAGAAYVPVDSAYPEQRVRYMLQASGARLVLTQRALLPVLSSLVDGDRLLCLDDAVAEDAGSAPVPAATPHPDNLAYVIFTSGSTGEPKGAMITHRGLVNYLRWCRLAYPLGDDGDVPVHSSVSFDLTVTSLLAPLTTGLCVQLLAEDDGVEALTRLVQSGSEIALVKITPPHLQLLGSRLSATAPGQVKSFVVGGENLFHDHIGFWQTHAPGARVVNEYGPTETVVGCCVYEATGDLRTTGPLPIGRPIANMRLYVLDESFDAVATGIAGELYIGGVQLGRGYLARPGMTAERFVPNPFATGAQDSRLYRTGDLARHLPDGNLEVIGRTDHQVKVLGFRIELGEIEAALKQQAGVRDAVVLARDDDQRLKRLLAYVTVTAAGHSLTGAGLRDTLHHTLPNYMVPAHVMVMERLPLTPNGKIDRDALPSPEEATTTTPYVAPRTPIEAQLAEIWQRVLHLDRIGVHHDFFELGGHSLMATQIIYRVTSAFGIDLPLRVLYDTTTIEALAERVATAQAHATSAPVPSSATLPATDDRALIARHAAQPPLSFAQQRLWFLDQYEPGTAYYNMPLAVQLTGALDAEALAWAFNETVRRHESLRTTFRSVDGTPLQVVAPELRLSLPVSSIAHAGDAAAALRDEAQRPFDLAQGPLMRARLLRAGPEDHTVLLTLHHIVSDGWSMQLLIREVGQLYAARLQGMPSTLAPPALQYGDFAHWQRQWLSGGVFEAQIDYWRGQLADAPTLLSLPLDHPRPALQSHHGAVHGFAIDAEVSASLRSLALRERATLFMVLTSAYAVLLGRYSGQDDLCLGTPVANRNQPELEDLIGLFINTLVLRLRLSPAESFSALLAQTHNTALQAYAHQDVPFEQLVDMLKVERSLSHSPLFQTMIALQNVPPASINMDGLRFEALNPETDTAKFDLTLNVSDALTGLQCAFEYNTDLFDAATIARMAGHFTRLLAAVAARPQAPLRELSMLEKDETAWLLHGWNQTSAGYDRSQTLQQLVEAQVMASPDAPALVHEGAVLSYTQLNCAANRLARRLRAWGVGPDVTVALCVERSLEMVVGLLAVHKAGGAYIPVDPALPLQRIAYMLDDSRPALLLSSTGTRASHAALAELLVGQTVPTLNITLQPSPENAPGTGEPVEAQEPDDGNLPAVAVPSNLAYVIYTSGSTGQPKGVAVTHASVVNFLHSMRRDIGITPADVMLSVTTLSFDIAVLELLLPLVRGAKVVLTPAETAGDPKLLLALIDASVATLMQATPSTWRMLVQSGLPWPRRPLGVLCGGEALTADLAAGLLERVSAVVNLYGPTETTIWSTLRRVTRDQPVPSLGLPVDNTQLYVLDAGLQPVPPGVAGELYIAGEGLARGYLRRPALTAQAFVPDPFAALPGTRMYRTGDLARRLPDGSLDYLGRVDHQVKVRGFRIELGEIETALATLPDVRQACVLLREDVAGDPRLVAYLVADDGQAALSDIGAVRSALAAGLPAYMLPSDVVCLAAWPLTPNGKLDRSALPAPNGAPALAADDRAPATPGELELAAIWEEVFDRQGLGAEQNFFEIGGHSLMAAQLVARVRSRLGIDLAIRALFEAPTIARLAAHIAEARAAGGGSDPQSLLNQPILPVPEGAQRPLSFAQERLWFLDHLAPGRAAYNMPTALRLRGQLNLDAMREALNAIVARHDALRTSFTDVAGTAVQIVAPVLALDLPITDLAGLPADQREQRAAALTQQEAVTPFRLDRDPLIRAGVLRLDDTDHILLLTLHHMVSDGWSLGLLANEMVALYGTRIANSAPALVLPPLPLQYPDYAYWQRERFVGSALASQLDYWTRQLAGAPQSITLPTDRPRPALQAYRGASHDFVVDATLTARLNQVSQRLQATLFMTLMTAFNILLSRYAGQDDICVGTVVANRERLETQNVIGFFANTLVIRTRLSGAESFADTLAQVRSTALEGYAHQAVPFEQLVEVLKPVRDLSHSPVFQVMLTLQNAPMVSVSLPGLTVETLDGHGAAAKFDLTTSATEVHGRLEWHWEYDADLFDATTIQAMAGHFVHLLDAIADAPQAPLRTLVLMDPRETQQLLVDWNDTARPYERSLTLHQRFEVQVARTPDAIAVVYEDLSLTYDQLNRAANRMAHHLRGLGVGPGTLVGACLTRSLDMVIALYAVIKAGSAYVPLDPDLPPRRMAAMLADARPAVVLSSEACATALADASAVGAAVFLMDSDSAALRTPDTDPHPLAVAANRAYVIYTSGSTGVPKGVTISHEGIVNRLQWMQETYPLTVGDRVLQKTPFNFDVSVWEFFWPLAEGATLVVARPGGHLDADYLADVIDAQAITTAHFVPPLLDVFLAQLAPGRGASLRRVICSGQALPLETQARFFAHFQDRSDRPGHPDGIGLYNLYGPTEASVDVSAWTCEPDTLLGVVPIGRPIANIQLYILDNDMAPVPRGVAGQLFIAGIGLAGAYLNRPALTAASFVPNPFGTPGERMYGTGDLARYLAGGAIDYLGRIDHQVKIRGLRIELGEIETALATLPGVRQAVVLNLDDRLVAYLTSQDLADASLEVGELRMALAGSLPDYMLPSHVVLLDALPLTPNGKIDRLALPLPDVPRAALNYVAPGTPTEEALTSIWADVLQREQVGVHDNFFEIGGHSLLVVKLQRQISARFEREFAVADLFIYTTIAKLATALDQVKPTGIVPTDTAIRAQTRRDRAATSQRRQAARNGR